MAGKGIKFYILIGLGIGLGFWIIDSGIQAFLFQESPLREEILNPSARSLYTRLVIISLLLTLCLRIEATKKNGHTKRQRLSTTLFESVAEAIVITDSDRNILTVNPAFTEVTGYTTNEVIGKNPSILQSGKHDESFYKAMSDTINKTGHWQGEIWNRRKNGEVYPEWLSISAVKDERGNVVRYAGIFNDITKRKQDEARVQSLAHYDQLTGLANRVLFTERLSEAIKQARRKTSHIAVLFLDLDGFKSINDTYGHLVGDEVLKETANRLLSCVRETDTVARSGGDEFLIILSNTTGRKDGAIAAKKIIRTLSHPFNIEGHNLSVGISIGITIAPRDGKEVTLLVKNADQAMYQAKNAGRNTFLFFSKEFDNGLVA